MASASDTSSAEPAKEHDIKSTALPDREADSLSRARRLMVQRVIATALAFTILGIGIGYLAGTRTDQPSAVDIGFLQDMIDHHDQAVEMSLISIAKPDLNGAVRNFATEVIVLQRREIGIMDAYLERLGGERGDIERTTMTWMGMGTPLRDMPGMATAERMNELKAAGGTTADRLFLDMMKQHHQGGLHMAQDAAGRASDPAVRAFAARIARYQATEIKEYEALQRRLGLIA